MIYVNIFFGLWAVFLVYMFKRNNAVFEYQKRLLARMRDLNDADLMVLTDPRPSLEERWRRFDRVTYTQMVLHFWRPLPSFYQGQDFNIEENENVKTNH